MGLAEMLMAHAMEQDDNEAPAILPEAAIMRLQEAAARYAEQIKGPRFKIGDIVVPCNGSDISLTGPQVVIDLRRNAEPNFELGEAGSNSLGMRLDIRVLAISRGTIHSHWVESYSFELWKPEV